MERIIAIVAGILGTLAVQKIICTVKKVKAKAAQAVRTLAGARHYRDLYKRQRDGARRFRDKYKSELAAVKKQLEDKSSRLTNARKWRDQYKAEMKDLRETVADMVLNPKKTKKKRA